MGNLNRLNKNLEMSKFHSAENPPPLSGWFLTIDGRGNFKELRYTPGIGWTDSLNQTLLIDVVYWLDLQINFLTF